MRLTMPFTNQGRCLRQCRCAELESADGARSPDQVERPDSKWRKKEGDMKDPLPWQRSTCDRLDALRDAWSNADAPTSEGGVLSSGEYVALSVACGFERLLMNPAALMAPTIPRQAADGAWTASARPVRSKLRRRMFAMLSSTSRICPSSVGQSIVGTRSWSAPAAAGRAA